MPQIRETLDFQAVIHDDDDGLWAEVPDMPGVFATGDTLDELEASLAEAIGLYLNVTVRGFEMTKPSQETRQLHVAV